MGLEKTPTIRDKKFLSFVRALGGPCILCRRRMGAEVPADDAHHFGSKGMGTKGSDYQVARLCREHHMEVQGKRRLAFARSGDWETLTALQEDSIALLEAYIVAIARGQV